jgi:pilus assembly protein CpaB
MKLLKNRFVIGALCILLALLFSFVAMPALQGGNQSLVTEVVRMKASVQAGTQLTAEMVEVMGVPEKVVKDGISDTAAVIGQYASADLYAGDYVTPEKLTATLGEQNPFSAGADKGKMVVSVTLPSLAAGVSGRILPGDIVTVIAVPKGPINQSLGLEPETTTDTVPAGAYVCPELEHRD